MFFNQDAGQLVMMGIKDPLNEFTTTDKLYSFTQP